MSFPVHTDRQTDRQAGQLAGQPNIPTLKITIYFCSTYTHTLLHTWLGYSVFVMLDLGVCLIEGRISRVLSPRDMNGDKALFVQVVPQNVGGVREALGKTEQVSCIKMPSHDPRDHQSKGEMIVFHDIPGSAAPSPSWLGPLAPGAGHTRQTNPRSSP